ncbi:hypothetical protein HID58_043968 [Brassica napus]|uniref:Uncharacterized protein n=1 Tax=Brassica napus TaxID=3708 RepID=A0ABQ8BJQ3_BRANA|nr:hypothetical protein HID58_043968 [Brassica napus]
MLRRTRMGIAASRQPAKKSFTSKREMSLRTDMPNTSSSTPKSSQGRHNKKTVLSMKIATSGDKEEHNRRRRHKLCEYGTSREIFSENFDGTTQLRNGQHQSMETRGFR